MFQYGDALAVVCADTPEAAEATVGKAKVELEQLPAYMNALDAIADDAIEIHPGMPNHFFTQNIKKGDDPTPLFDTAPNLVEVKTHLQGQPHLYLEPDCGFAYMDEEGRVTIHSKSKARVNPRSSSCTTRRDMAPPAPAPSPPRCARDQVGPSGVVARLLA